MSEAGAADKAPAPAGGGNKMLLLIVLVVNVLIAGGLAYVVISNQKSAAAAAAALSAKKEGGEEHEAAEGEGEGEQAAAEEGHAKKGGGGKFGPLVEIGTFVANLTTASGQSRYAKVALHVEATNEDAKTKVEAAVVPIRSESLLFLSGLSAEQVIGQEKIRQLQEDLQKRLSELVGKNTIKHVYFSEFVVQ
jgi:flagellar FliL protein